jgi:outer membrane protein assembly factor BamA
MCKSPLILFLFLALVINTSAQSADYFLVSDIIINGNKHTKSNVIFNELDFSIGDTIYTSALPIRKRENEKRLLGTALFTGVELNINNWNIENGTANIVLTLQENWFIYPSLLFEIADRNFNVWWTDQNRDFSRVNYGLSVDHINVTGRKDKLKLKIQHGYTRKYELKYNYPYISQTWGAFGEIFFANQKEIGYATFDNKTVFEKLDDERILLKRFRTGLGANYRPDVYHFHDFKLEYHHNSIDDYIATEVAPDYFLNGETNLRYFALKYNFIYDKRIFNLYPEGGFMFFGNITKEGLGIFDDFNNLSVTAGIEKYFQLGAKWIWGGRIKAKTNLIRNTVAFANNTGLGYGNDLVRGYELYVVDGTDWAIAKTSLRYRLYKKNINWGKYMFLQEFKQMNFRLFLRANLDFGYVNEPTYKNTNELNNRFLVGYGPALDMLLYHTFIMSFEYSFNHLGEGGLFLSSSFNF